MKLRAFWQTSLALFLLLVMAVSIACSSSSSSQFRPKVLVSQETLTEILKEVHLIEAAMNMRRNNGQEFDQQKNALYDMLFTHYAITPQLLEENLLFYNQRPEVMEKVYQNVIDSLMSMQKSLRLEDIPSR
jgi:hypothetical protein